jgi:hypothetical protein
MRHGPAAKAMRPGAKRRLPKTNHAGNASLMSASARWPGGVQEKRSHKQNRPNISPSTPDVVSMLRPTLLTVLLPMPSESS